MSTVPMMRNPMTRENSLGMNKWLPLANCFLWKKSVSWFSTSGVISFVSFPHLFSLTKKHHFLSTLNNPKFSINHLKMYWRSISHMGVIKKASYPALFWKRKGSHGQKNWGRMPLSSSSWKFTVNKDIKVWWWGHLWTLGLWILVR